MKSLWEAELLETVLLSAGVAAESQEGIRISVNTLIRPCRNQCPMAF